MSVILGLNAYHPDASACLLIDGKVVAAVAEERLGKREKHTDNFPINAINWLLNAHNLLIEDVDQIAIARDPNANKLAKLLYILKNPETAFKMVNRFRTRNSTAADALENLVFHLPTQSKRPKFQIVPVEHHLAHIASSYYCSNFETSTLGFSFDGAGDFASVMVAKCVGTKIEVLKRAIAPDSFGHFYSAMCQFIGFDGYGEEYKVMGLAPYGTDEFSAQVSKLMFRSNKNIIKLNSKYISPVQYEKAEYRDEQNQLRRSFLFTNELADLLDVKYRKREEALLQSHKNIAKSTQVHFENTVIEVLNHFQEETKSKYLASAGGCALNGVTNSRILRDTNFEANYIQPAASDDGLAIGAALYCWHNVLNRQERFHLNHAYLGPKYTISDIKIALDEKSLKYIDLGSDGASIEKISELLVEGKVIGWYQGSSEWGPRALGNRSILANPLLKNMKDTINAKVKKRESFRPFAPSVLKEDVKEYFEQDIYSPFMMHVVRFKDKYRSHFPSVTHVDYTGRLQSVSTELNPKYYNLIKRFKEKTGFGILLNTSFNENEPIVDTPEQAINCFLRTDIDALLLDNILVTK